VQRGRIEQRNANAILEELAECLDTVKPSDFVRATKRRRVDASTMHVFSHIILGKLYLSTHHGVYPVSREQDASPFLLTDH